MFLPSKPRSHPKEAQRPHFLDPLPTFLQFDLERPNVGMITNVWEERVLGSATPHPKGLGPNVPEIFGTPMYAHTP